MGDRQKSNRNNKAEAKSNNLDYWTKKKKKMVGKCI